MKPPRELRPFGRAVLNRPTVVLLAAMRVYVVIAVAIAIYAFVRHVQ